MGGSSSTKTEDGTSNSQQDPWAAQQPYILNAFQQAQNTYDNGQGPYTGAITAGGTAQQNQANTGAFNWATGTGANTVQSILNNGTSMFGTGAGTTSSALGGLLNKGTTDQTAANLAAANAYASNPFIASATRAAMSSANEEAANSTLPSLYRNAASSGNINSDRTAISDGLVRQGLAEKAADISANLSNSAYSNGISAALQQQSQGNSALGVAAGIGQGQQQSGLNALSTAINDQAANNNQAQQGANANQALNQLTATNNFQQYSTQQQYPWQQLQNLYNIVGSRSWGSNTTGTTTGTSTTQNNPSALSSIGSVLGLFGSII